MSDTTPPAQQPLFSNKIDQAITHMVDFNHIDLGPTIPILFKVTNSNWQPSGCPDINYSSKAGNVWTATATMYGIRVLDSDPEVVSVELSR